LWIKLILGLAKADFCPGMGIMIVMKAVEFGIDEILQGPDFGARLGQPNSNKQARVVAGDILAVVRKVLQMLYVALTLTNRDVEGAFFTGRVASGGR
jgi:hypothetical protein